jgi:Spy/CpxP family protein refolding chaperone
MMGRRGGPQGRPGGPPAAESTEAKELRKVLESDDTPDNEIKAKLKALRDARKKSDDALKKAREELREVLTTRQEARLVLSGILD